MTPDKQRDDEPARPWWVFINHDDCEPADTLDEVRRLASWYLLSGTARVVAIVGPDGAEYCFSLEDAVRVKSAT